MATAESRERSPGISLADASELLFDEAQLLDARDYEAWLGLFAPNALYRVGAGAGPDPSIDLALVHDTSADLQARVRRLLSGRQYSQEPPSRTCHQISNVRLISTTEGTATVTSVLVVFESRLGRDRWYAGRCRHELLGTTEGLLIERKHVDLIHADQFLGSLTFGL